MKRADKESSVIYIRETWVLNTICFSEKELCVCLMEMTEKPLCVVFFFPHKYQIERFVYISINVIPGSKFRGKEKTKRKKSSGNGERDKERKK